MNKINIVIPMAGAGSRFAKEGYDRAKPFIYFNGKMMIEHVLDSINMHKHAYHLIIRDEFYKIYPEELSKLSNAYPVEFLSVEKVTQGASCTVLALHNKINNNLPLMIIDSDNLYSQGIINDFADKAVHSDIDGLILTFNSKNPNFSYVKINDQDLAISIIEKQAISNNAICGAYYFSHGHDFVDSTIECLIYGDRQVGEYYISGVYQNMIKRQKKIAIHKITAEDWHCVGTPKQLEEYLVTIK